MEWTDEGIVLGVRKHGEASTILELITRAHGRHLGLVRGGTGARLRPVLQPGNSVRAVWRARLDEHLGSYTIEGLQLRAASFLLASHALYGLAHVAALARLLPERDPHLAVYEAIETILQDLHDPLTSGAQIVRFELQMLAELGFGLDLSECAATGTTEELIYVSPRSGRAVSRDAGQAWRDKLLQLPGFLVEEEAQTPSLDDIEHGFALTGFFLARHVLEPRGENLADARAHFIAAVTRTLPSVA
jgi:DNA repair protein RecO (recombination protein O)